MGIILQWFRQTLQNGFQNEYIEIIIFLILCLLILFRLTHVAAPRVMTLHLEKHSSSSINIFHPHNTILNLTTGTSAYRSIMDSLMIKLNERSVCQSRFDWSNQDRGRKTQPLQKPENRSLSEWKWRGTRKQFVQRTFYWKLTIKKILSSVSFCAWSTSYYQMLSFQ